MVVVTFKIEHILVQFSLGICALVLLFNYRTIGVFDLGFIFVTLVVTTCVRAVLRPWSHAHPAELVVTPTCLLPTGHVVASLVLFDGFSAHRSLFRVGQNPGYVLALGRIFKLPIPDDLAGTRAMGFFTTGKTIHKISSTSDLFDA